MSDMQRAYRYLLAEPFTWMFYAFFQPRRFDREMEKEGHWQRFIRLLRIIVRMLLLVFLFGLLGAAIVGFVVVVVLGIVVGIVGGIAFGIVGGIAFGIVGGIVGGPLGVLTVGQAFLVPYL